MIENLRRKIIKSKTRLSHYRARFNLSVVTVKLPTSQKRIHHNGDLRCGEFLPAWTTLVVTRYASIRRNES